MSGPIDPRTIRPGGKVSVTLTDGTKIIDSPVSPPNGERHGLFKWAVCGLLNVEGIYIASIDAYTPPTPEWDRPEVFAVVDDQGGLWHRCLTAKGRVRTNGLWQCGINVRSSSDIVATRSGPFTIVAEVHQ